MAQVTDRHAIIVSHGSPSHPQGQEAEIAALASDVATHLPGWTVRGATLASTGGLVAAMDGVRNPLIYPLFMAPGWFTDVCLPRRLGPRPVRRLPPLGVDPDLPGLINAELETALHARGWIARDTALVIAAHGSSAHPQSGEAVRGFAERLAGLAGPRSLNLGFIEEAPFLHDAARISDPAVCVPFFAIAAGHVSHDVPNALAAAGFNGVVLPPAIAYRGLPRFIATAIDRAQRDRRAA